jgi:Zn-dependent M28 family amino/carboxypeptidase
VRRARVSKPFLTTLCVVAGLVAAACFYVAQPLFVTGADARATGEPVDPKRLEAHVRMLAGTLSPRNERRTDNLDRIADYVGRELAFAGGAVTEQPFRVGNGTYRNVIATFGPQGGELIVVGAHYDAYGELPGADDNASGVAGLIELGRLLGKTAPRRQVQLVAYTLEEPPHFRTQSMGSAVHADSLQKAGVRVRAMLSLEMIGYFSDAPGSQSYPVAALHLLYPSEGNFIAVVGRFGEAALVRGVKRSMAAATSLPVRSINAPTSLVGVDFSDHLNFWNRGYPAAMITDTAFMRNLAYHSEGDTPDRLDYAKMAQVVAGVHAAVQALSLED